MKKRILTVAICTMVALGLLAVTTAIRIRNAKNCMKMNPDKVVVIDGIPYHAQVLDTGDSQIMFFIERSDLEGTDLFD